MLFAFSNKLGCGGSLLVSVIGSMILLGLMLAVNSCLAGGAPLVAPGAGPGAPESVSEAVEPEGAPAVPGPVDEPASP